MTRTQLVLCLCSAVWCAALCSSLPLSAQLTIHGDSVLQQVLGSGAALTGASTYVIKDQMNKTLRAQWLHRLYAPFGLGGVQFNAMRIVMGTCDFNLLNYTYDELPEGVTSDFNMSYFSVEQDMAYVIPTILEALSINPSIRIIATPWTAPSWMKVPQTLNGGVLSNDTAIRKAYAKYFRRYVETYRFYGIPIFAVTVQNEPRFQTPIYPSMQMSPADEIQMALLIAEEFERSDIIQNRTKVIVYDHNWDDPQYPIDVLSNPAVNQSDTIIGSAFHCYNGDVSAQLLVHDAVPSKRIYFTECCGGGWAPNFTSNLVWDTQNLVLGAVNGWAETVTKWNMILDAACGPHLPQACSNCWGLATLETDGSITYNDDFYAMAHLSIFLNTTGDNHRLNVSDASQALAIAVNTSQPHPALVLLYLNPQSEPMKVNVTVASPLGAPLVTCQFALTLPPASVATFKMMPHTPEVGVEWVLTSGDKTHLLQSQPSLPLSCH